jgi:uncharacterized metal-binding protein YceD (DUF177 family)
MAHAHLAVSPTVLRLKELPQEGRRYIYTNASGELTPFIADLIGKNPYRVEIEVKPMGNVYMAEGKIETGLDEICSLCALEFVYSVNEKFREILVINDHQSHRDHQARVNHTSELAAGGPECTELDSDLFMVGDFIHELIAISAPMKPLGKPDCDSSCENYKAAVAKGWFGNQGESMTEKQNPFAVLKDLKLRS